MFLEWCESCKFCTFSCILSANLQMAGESMRVQIARIGFELAFLENEKVSLYYKCSI